MSNIVPSNNFGGLVPNYDKPTFNPVGGFTRLVTEIAIDTKEQVEIAHGNYEMRRLAQDFMMAGAVEQVKQFVEFKKQRGADPEVCDWLSQQAMGVLHRRTRH
ncbi:hypothetical protein [Aerosakkonema funiforme]|uniref:hypothetical protein n=1 Tax=Aerosakkonema funiforme TaxID=1246630 RepID=UPI0035B9308F